MTKTSSSGDTVHQTLPPPVPAVGSRRARRRSRRKNGLGLLVVAMLIVAVGVASLLRLPYYQLSPGSVYNTIERVQAPAEQVHIPTGEIAFVTISQVADISIWQWLSAQIDDDVIIKHEDEINGDRTTEEKREQDQRRMQLSKNDAVVVALQRLGYDLIVTPLGIEVAAVFECSAADGVLGTGDVIIGLDDAEIREMGQLVDALAQRAVGDEIELLVERIDPSDSARTLLTEPVSLTLGSADDDCLADDIEAEEPRAFIGIGTHQMVDEELPFEVDIDTGRVGGPSAGLAFTLAIIDVLSEGELTNGLTIVATGTIDRNGVVGAVGGVHQKTVAAEEAGADIFLVPMCCENLIDATTGEEIPSNFDEAVEHADEMRVVGVETLDDALRAIGELGGDVSPFLVAN